MIIYADTSALAKLVITEDGSAEMQSEYRAADAVGSAAIAYVELRAAVARAARGKRLSSPREDVAAAVERLWQEVTELALAWSLLRTAADLAEQMRLRAYDAVHLAALSLLGEPDRVTFACWDEDLRAAARQLGYALIPA